MSTFFWLLATLLVVILAYIRYSFQYWERRGILQPGVNKYFGTFFQLKSVHSLELVEKHYTEFKRKTKVLGSYLYLEPILFILDLDLVKNILIRDFNYFVDRDGFCKDEFEPLGLNVFAQRGERWRTLRQKITPTFTSGKMKLMFPLIAKVADDFIELCKQEVDNVPDGIVELYDLNARFTTDVIGNCILGIECNSLNQANNEFRRIGREIFQPNRRSIRWRIFELRYRHIFRWFGIRVNSDIVYNFLHRTVVETMKYRSENNIKRNDFLDMLIEERNKKDENGNYGLTLNEVIAQVFIFFAAGFETSSSSITYAIYDLARHPDMQEKVREEIKNVLEKHNGELTYECMEEMKYLNLVLTESMRSHCALPILTRVAQEDYKIPETNLIIPKGTQVFIPVSEIHKDPDVYENPEEFIPERFLPEEIKKRHPLSYLNFGDGPRNCVGLRFGKMQTRIGIIKLLKNFKFEVCKDTPTSFEPCIFALVNAPAKGVHLKATKISH